jgi:hypothetical protein
MNEPSISAILPFKEESSDPLFQEVLKQLRVKKNPLSEEDLFRIYLEARDDIVYAIGICGAFWTAFHESDVIGVASPVTSFYNVLFTRAGVAVKYMSNETAKRSFRLLSMDGHEPIAEATDAFLNAMIRELKKPDMVLACATF